MITEQYKKYKEQSILTLSPNELVTLLFDEIIKNINKAIFCINSKKTNDAHNNIIKAENIFLYLIDNLDMKFPISKELLKLYDYIYNRLIQANVKKDTEILEEILDMASELKSTWAQADKMSRTYSGTKSESII